MLTQENSLCKSHRTEINRLCLSPSPVKFYKGGSQEKTHLPRPEFFLLPSPTDRVRAALNDRAMDSGVGPYDPAVWVFSTSGFHQLFATKPVSFRNQQAVRWSQVATIVLSGTRGPYLFRVVREG